MTIEQLEALEKAATAGPWTEWIGNTSVHFGVRIEKNVPWMLVGADGVVCKCDNMDSECKRQAVQDSAFIAAARNALPDLLAVAKAAKECKELLQDMIPPKECTCKNDEECGDCYFFGGKRQVLEMVTQALARLEAQ